MKSKSIMRYILLALALISLCFMMSPGQSSAGVGGSDTPTVPSSVFVGQTGVPFSFTISNESTPDNDDNNIRVLYLFFTTACGDSSNATLPCPAGQTESGVIVISPLTASGRAGTACADKDFNVVANGNPSEYQFIPIGGDVILGPSDDSGPIPPECIVDFTVNIVGSPVRHPDFTYQLARTNNPLIPNAGMVDESEEPLLYGGAQGTEVLFVLEPCVEIDKTCDLLSKEGDEVDYTITVHNCSPEDLPPLNCTITDSKIGINKQVQLESDEQDTTHNDPQYVVPDGEYPGPLENTATVSCTVEGFPSVSVSPEHPENGTCQVDLFEPCVEVKCTPDNKEVKVGDPVNYHITVENCIRCDNCKLETLESLPSLNCNITDTPDNILTKIPKNNVLIAPGDIDVTDETRNYQATDPNTLTNTIFANCTVVGFGNPKSHSNPCSVKESEENGGGGPERPYKAAINDDTLIPNFYISQKLDQFTYPATAYNCETFQHSGLKEMPEVCCTQETKNKIGACPCVDPDNTIDCQNTENYLVGWNNSGWYKWAIQLPEKPVGELNIQIECGIVKPNTFKIWEPDPTFEAIDICAAETGEISQSQSCIRTKNYLKPEALPTLAVMAYHGCQGDGYDPFYLTAYRTPAAYGVSHTNTPYMQVLNGDIDTDPVAVGIQGDPKTRIALKPCMEKSIMIKYPVAGWMNAAGQQETDLQAGDIILVTLQIPKANTVDIYCNKYSVKIGGIGEPEVIPQASCTYPAYPWCPQCSNWYCTSGQ